MAIKFNHRREILALRDGIPKYLEAYTPIKVKWESDFAENDFRDAYISGKGKNERLVLSTEILAGSKSLPVTFNEDAAGELTVEINGAKIYTIKPSGRISKGLLKAFTQSIIKGIQ
jgi:hypothetical protein